MSEQPSSGSLIVRSAVHRIRVYGRLNPDWSERLQGMAISKVEKEGHGTFSKLVGLLPDQAVLMGVLQTLYNSGVLVVSVECVTPMNRRPPQGG